MNRVRDVKRLYRILDRLEKKLGGKKSIVECIEAENLPEKGLYFAFEQGENRSTSGNGPRIVRIGAHALMPSSRSSMLNRMRLDRGNENDDGGKHRRSMLRKHIGRAIMKRDRITCGTWEKRVQPGPREQKLEEKISAYIRGKMSFLYLEVNDSPADWKARKDFERNLIALLSNFQRSEKIDLPSRKWLGNSFPDRINEMVSESGLWNEKHAEREYDQAFLDLLEKYVDKMKTSKTQRSKKSTE